MPRRRGNPGPNDNNNSNNNVFPVGRGGRGGRGRGRGRGGRGGRGRGGPPSNPNLDLNVQSQPQPQPQDRLQPDPPARPLPQTQPPQQTQRPPRSRSQAQPPLETLPPSLGPLLSQGLQTSYTLDLFNNLSLNPGHGKDSAVVFEGNFDDFTLGNSTTNQPHSRAQRQSQPQPQQSSNPPPPAPVHAPQGPVPRGRGGPWRGGGWRGRPSVYGAPSLPFTPPFRKGGPNPKNIRGGGLGYAHPVIQNAGRSPQYPKRPTTFSKTPRIPLEILERDRPLLKPVTFVRGEQQTLLFKEKEEILHVPGEEKEHADRVLPSADIVEEIFHIRPSQAEEAEESHSKSETEDHTDTNTPNSVPAETGEIAELNIEATSSLAVDPTIELFVQREEHTSSISLPNEVTIEQREASTTVLTEIVMKDEVEKIESGSDPLPSSISVPVASSLDDANPLPQPETQLFIISTDPTTTDDIDDTNPNTDIQYISTRSQTPLGVASDDEVIYEAPNRHKHSRPTASSKVASTSTSTPHKAPAINPTPLSVLPSLTLELTPTSVLIQRTVKAQAKSGLKITPRMRRMVMLGKGTQRRKGSSLFALGLEREERILESDSNLGKERRGMKEKRRHDSDLDWGTEEDSEEESKNAFKASKSKSSDQEEEPDFDPSELDPDINLKDLLRFAQGAEALSKGNGTGQTIDDLEDGRRMDEEDEDEDTGSGTKSTSDTGEDENDNEKEDVFDEAERKAIGELDDESSSDSSSSSEVEDFQTKLNKLRAKNGTKQVKGSRWKKEHKEKGKGKQKAIFLSDTDSSEDDDADDWSDDVEVVAKADKDERFISEIQELLDENEDILQSHVSGRKKEKQKNRKERRKFRAVYNGSFGREDSDFDYEDQVDRGLLDISYNSTKRDKSNHLPPGLKERWEQDRAKKAERKRERQLQREIEQMELAVHLSPSGKGKLSKLQRNLLQRSAVDSSSMLTSYISWDALKFEYVSSSTIRVSKISDLSALDTLIRSTFLPNLDIQTVILPPKDKQWRAKAHELCNAFYLKNKSEGREGNRFLTISRTSMTGVGMKEGKISNILRKSARVERSGGGGWVRDKGKAEGGRGHVKVRTRDGDEVGAAAPKIDSSNIGFKILEKMGWSEGQRIGITGGLADPLTAIIKTSKLGLGATR